MNNRILMIDNYDSFTFNLVQYLGELGAQVTVRRNDAIDIAGVRALAPDAIVMRNDSPCHCIPRLNAPSAPPMIRSAPRNSPGPIVLANAGTKVVRLLKLVSAFCSIVSGCSRAPSRCVCAFQSASLLNSAAKCGSQKAM